MRRLAFVLAFAPAFSASCVDRPEGADLAPRDHVIQRCGFPPAGCPELERWATCVRFAALEKIIVVDL